MKIKIVLVAALAIAVVGCQSAAAQKGKVVEQEVKKSAPVIGYNPEGREQFVFAEKATVLQKFGYDNFCRDTKTFACMNKLPYEKYVGVRGFFASETPTYSDSYGYDFYPVVLDTGEQFYFVVRKKGGKYGTLSPLIPLAQHLELKSFKAEPLVPGSAIELVKVDQSYGIKTFKLSNGNSIQDKKLKNVRELAVRFGGKPSLAELLLNVDIEKDEIENRYFIQPSGSPLRTEAKLYIGANESKIWLRFKVKYYGDDWLFVNGYKVAADDYRWQSPQLKFERDHASGSVWEWIDIAAGSKEIEIAKAIASAKESTIRFQGNQYYSDKKLEDDQKESIKVILRIFSEMSGGV